MKKTHLLSLLMIVVCGWRMAAQPSVGMIPLGSSVNSVYDESYPVFSPDGQLFYLMRERHPQNMGLDNNADIWVSYRRPGGEWSRAVHAGTTLNDRNGNRVINVSPSGHKLYLLGKEQDRPVLFESSRNDRIWGTPRRIDLPVVDRIRSFHLSCDGRYLVFSAPGPGEEEQLDLFLSQRSGNGEWSRAIPLGPAINTAGDEVQSFLAADGETLYFTSTGHPGLGGQDWFMSRRLDDTWKQWSAPLTLGPPVNSSFDEGPITVAVSGETVYFSRPVAGAGLDLFRAPLPESLRARPVKLLSGRILTGSPVAERVSLQVEPLPGGTGLRQLEITPDGRYAILAPQDSQVRLRAETEGFFAVSEYLPPPERSQEEVDAARNMLVARELDPAYWQRETEIQDLQLQLRKLDEELRNLNRERKEYRENQPSDRPKELFSDPQLEALRHRYGQLGHRDTSRNDQLRAKGPEAYEGSEADLAEMKRQYRDHFAEEARESDEFVWKEDPYLETQGEDGLEPLDLIGSAARELEGELSPQEQRLLRQQEAEFKAALSEGLRGPRRLPTDVSEDTVRSEDWQLRLEEDVLFREEETTPVPADTSAFKAFVKEALRENVAYSRKKELADELRRELSEKLTDQIHTEEELVAKGVPPVGPDERATRLPSASTGRDVKLLPVEAGQILPLRNVFFAADTYELKPASEPELQSVLALLRQNEKRVVEIGVHTHGWMPHARANQLSEERAATIANYLIVRGISSARVLYRGYGKTQPLTSNDTAAGRRRNQRVELSILE